MFFYLLFVPSALLSIVMIAYLRGLKKHDTALYSLCQRRRDIIQFLWKNRGTLTREEYLAVRKLLDTIKLPPVPPKHGEEEERDLRRRAVRRVSSGSVLIQQGQYLTRQDIEKRKKALLQRRAK